MSNEDNRLDKQYQALPQEEIDVLNNQNAGNTNNMTTNNQRINSPFDPFDDQRNKNPVANAVPYFFSIVFNLIWYFLFLSFTTYPEHFGSPKECVELLRLSINIMNFFYILLIFNIVLMVLSCCLENKCASALHLTTSIIFHPYAFIMLLIYVFSMMSTLKLGEKCGDLHTLAMVWLILTIVVFVGSCCICCCCVCFILLTGTAFSLQQPQRVQ